MQQILIIRVETLSLPIEIRLRSAIEFKLCDLVDLTFAARLRLSFDYLTHIEFAYIPVLMSKIKKKVKMT